MDKICSCGQKINCQNTIFEYIAPPPTIVIVLHRKIYDFSQTQTNFPRLKPETKNETIVWSLSKLPHSPPSPPKYENNLVITPNRLFSFRLRTKNFLQICYAREISLNLHREISLNPHPFLQERNKISISVRFVKLCKEMKSREKIWFSTMTVSLHLNNASNPPV